MKPSLRLVRTPIVLVLSLLLSPVPLLADETSDETASEEPWLIRESRKRYEESKRRKPAASHFQDFAPGKSLRVQGSVLQVDGAFERFVADTLWLRPESAAGPLSFPADSIRGLWTRGNSAGTGAIVGGALGLASSLLLNAAYSSSDDVEVNEGGSIGLFTISGVAVGALVGAVIPRWRRHP